MRSFDRYLPHFEDYAEKAAGHHFWPCLAAVSSVIALLAILAEAVTL